MTVGKAIRAFCIDCVGDGSSHAVRDCGGDKCLNGGTEEDGKTCLFYRYRMGHGRPSAKVVRKVCIWCQGERLDWVRECDTKECFLYPFRMGRSPGQATRKGRPVEVFRRVIRDLSHKRYQTRERRKEHESTNQSTDN